MTAPAGLKAFRAAVVLPVVSDPIADGVVITSGGRIVELGPWGALRDRLSGVPVRDLGAAILMPRLVNCHTHLQLSNLAGRIPLPQPFTQWIRNMVHERLTRAAVDDMAAYTCSAVDVMARTGTIGVGDIASQDLSLGPLSDAGMWGVVYFEVYDTLLEARVPELMLNAQRAVDDWRKRLPGRLRAGVTMHAPYTVTPRLFKEATDWARREGLDVCIHAAESPAETEFLMTAGGPIKAELYRLADWNEIKWRPPGVSTVKYLAGLGCLDAGPLLVHGVQVSDEDIDIIAATGSRLAHCPRSNQGLEAGRAPVERYLSKGVAVGLGTDSLASAPSLNLWDEMVAAVRMHGLAVSARQIVEMATIGSARAVKADPDLGSLEPGKAAIMLALRPEAVPSVDEVWEYVATRGHEADIEPIEG